ncbi:MAG TPA: hypothetical protein VFF63_08835 [Candidatus Babeliales bacterium]|nr:hypothetical protein [Candidatus Babeliales bacterium]
MNCKRLGLGVAALVVLAGAPRLAPAQQHLALRHPIEVNACNAKSHRGYLPAGWGPAYYPPGSGPYWGWPSVYGAMFYQYPTAGNPTLGIDYVNTTNLVMKDVEFGLVAGGNVVAGVRDLGKFSPGAEIKHAFGINPNVFPLPAGSATCVALRITFADGSKWKNPHPPSLSRSFYGQP